MQTCLIQGIDLKHLGLVLPHCMTVCIVPGSPPHSTWPECMTGTTPGGPFLHGKPPPRFVERTIFYSSVPVFFFMSPAIDCFCQV